MSTQTTRVVPAFINIFTNATDAVKVVAGFTLTAVGAQQVDTTVACTDLFGSLTFININAACALFIEVVSSTTVNRVPLAGVGADRVDTDLTSVAWTSLADTFIDIDTVSEGVLDESSPTLYLGEATEGALRVLAFKLRPAVMDTSLTLINIFAVVVVSELIASSTADLSLATE